jgi:hypothetical protein
MTDDPPGFRNDARNPEPVGKKLAWLVILFLGAATLVLPWLIVGDLGSLNPDAPGARPRTRPVASRKLVRPGGPRPVASASVPGSPSGH